jgi:hypothetical protein
MTEHTRVPGQANAPGRNGRVHASTRPRARRRPLDGPVIADLSEASGPRIAAVDAAWAAMVLAGGAADATQLRDWLEMVGLLDTPPYWCAA